MSNQKSRYGQIVLAVLLSIVFAATASAAVQITDEKIAIEVDYNKFSDEDQKQITVNGQLTVSNTGTENVAAVLVFEGLPADYTAEEITNIMLAAGETKTISYVLKVPHEKDSGASTIGSAVLKEATTKAVLASKSLVQNTKSMLLLSELKVEYTDKEGKLQTEKFNGEKNNQDEEFNLDGKVKPGTEMTFTFSIENLFDRDYDQDYGELDEVELIIEPDDKDVFQNRQFDETYSFDRLDARKEDSKVISFTVSDTVDPDEFFFEITLEAEDGRNLNHKVEKKLVFSVERVRDDVRIVSAEMTPASVTCEQEAVLHVKIQNFGTNDQDYAGLIIYNQKLGVKENIHDIELSRASKSGNSYEYSLSVPITQDLTAGTYPFDVTVLIQKDKSADSKVVPFKIEKRTNCGTEEKTSSSGSGNTETTSTTATVEVPTQVVTEETTPTKTPATEQENKETTTPTTSTVVKTVEDPYTRADIIAGLLIVAVVFIFAFITWELVLLFKKE